MARVTREHIEARRRQILSAAVTCFARNGVHQTTIQDLAREAGVSAGTPYTYFDSKEEIIEELARQGFADCTALADRLAAMPSVRDALGDLMELFRDASTCRAEEMDRLEVVLWGEAARNPRINELFNKNITVLMSALEATVERGRETGELRPDVNPRAVAAAFLSVFQGLVLLKALDARTDTRGTWEVVEAWMVGAFWSEAAS